VRSPQHLARVRSIPRTKRRRVRRPFRSASSVTEARSLLPRHARSPAQSPPIILTYRQNLASRVLQVGRSGVERGMGGGAHEAPNRARTKSFEDCFRAWFGHGRTEPLGLIARDPQLGPDLAQGRPSARLLRAVGTGSGRTIIARRNLRLPGSRPTWPRSHVRLSARGAVRAGASGRCHPRTRTRRDRRGWCGCRRRTRWRSPHGQRTCAWLVDFADLATHTVGPDARPMNGRVRSRVHVSLRTPHATGRLADRGGTMDERRTADPRASRRQRAVTFSHERRPTP
jgi:hypothetical protein